MTKEIIYQNYNLQYYLYFIAIPIIFFLLTIVNVQLFFFHIIIIIIFIHYVYKFVTTPYLMFLEKQNSTYWHCYYNDKTIYYAKVNIEYSSLWLGIIIISIENDNFSDIATILASNIRIKLFAEMLSRPTKKY